MTYEGVLKKMQTEFENPIQYYLIFQDSFLNVNQLLDKDVIELHEKKTGKFRKIKNLNN